MNLRIVTERGLKLGTGRGLEEMRPKLVIWLLLDKGTRLKADGERDRLGWGWRRG